MLKENIEQRRNTGISFIINAHKERGVLVPALKSVLLAAKECKQANIETEIILVADKVDSVTKNIIQSWRQHIDFVDFVEFGNLGLARNHALNLATKDYFCFLDGDDIWQKEWPAKAYFFAQANDPLNTVFHTELFVSFGDHYEVRKQIQTTDPLFHPTHLAISWHFCNNLFAHRNVFERVPLMPYDHSKGFGSEDWHWSCETLAVGIRLMAKRRQLQS